MNEIINQLMLDQARFRCCIAYYEKLIAETDIAIERIVQSKFAQSIVTAEQVVTNVPGVYKMVKAILDEHPEEVLEYRKIKAQCLNRYPDQRDRIIRQVWNVCNALAQKGKIKMPERKRQKNETNRITNVELNGHSTIVGSERHASV